MIPLVAGVLGLVLGLLASPNPAVALMSGAFFGVLAWALTGFKIGAKTAVSVPELTLGTAKPAISGSRFTINDHGEVSPAQLGAIFVERSFAMTEETVGMLFKPGKPGTKLPIIQSVADDPLPARLFLLAFLIAAYYIYPMKRLAVDQSTRHGIMDGSIAELASLKNPDGRLFGREDIAGVQEMIVSFYELLIDDIDFQRNDQQDLVDPKTVPPKSTALLLSLLVSHYNGGGQLSQSALIKLSLQGFYDPAYAATTQAIDGLRRIPWNTLEGLNLMWLKV